jgi:dipeptidyl aminopeptidase/acylaminoacyl peptidase
MRIRHAAAAAAVVVLVTAALSAQAPAPASSGYLTPPKAIVDILDADPLPTVVVSPNHEVMAVLPRRSMPSIAEVSQPMLRLAGIRINPRTNGPHRAQVSTGITLRSTKGGTERTVVLPAGARISGLSFSPDGKRFAFMNTRDTGIDLYIADVATGQAKLVPGAAMNGLAGGCDWLDDSTALVCPFVASARGPAPVEAKVPAGPNIQENYGKPGPVATYEDMLTSAHDEDLFEYYMTSQLAVVNPSTLQRTPMGKPAMIGSVAAAPNGQFVLVEKVKRPFSRLVPWSDFPEDVEIWNRRGEKIRAVADVPMGDTVPINGVMTGPRAYRWVPTEPATIMWVEALDKGDIKNDVPSRDRIVTLKAPFAGDPAEVAKTQYRYAGASWTDLGSIILTESDRKTRTTRTWVMNASWGEARKLWDRKQQDAYANPG